MRSLAAIRHWQYRASRLIATVFAIGWLGFAVAPCQASPLAGSMPADDCGHCLTVPSDADNGCAMVAASDCLSDGLALLEHRDTDLPQPAAGPLSAHPQSVASIADCGPRRDTRARRLLVSHVSIQQRYCTYQI